MLQQRNSAVLGRCLSTRPIANSLGPSGIRQRAEALLNMAARRCDARYHQAQCTATYGVHQKLGQLRIPIWYMRWFDALLHNLDVSSADSAGPRIPKSQGHIPNELIAIDGKSAAMSVNPVAPGQRVWI
jgi:hypothetical protein